MAMQLVPRMAELVDCNKSAFIRGKCIKDNFVLVHQFTSLLHQKKVLTLLRLSWAWRAWFSPDVVYGRLHPLAAAVVPSDVPDV
jgi:hypothetical protein